jgi:hypothetical protein
LSWILGGLDAFYKSSCDTDLVEYQSGPNHDDAGNDFEIDNRLSGETEPSIVELECSNCLCKELWLRGQHSLLQVRFIYCSRYAIVIWNQNCGLPRQRYNPVMCTELQQ